MKKELLFLLLLSTQIYAMKTPRRNFSVSPRKSKSDDHVSKKRLSPIKKDDESVSPRGDFHVIDQGNMFYFDVTLNAKDYKKLKNSLLAGGDAYLLLKKLELHTVLEAYLREEDKDNKFLNILFDHYKTLDLTKQDGNGETLLHRSVSNFAVLSKLLAHATSEEKNIQNKKGETVLHAAVRKNARTLALIVGYKVCIDIKDMGGYTASQRLLQKIELDSNEYLLPLVKVIKKYGHRCQK